PVLRYGVRLRGRVDRNPRLDLRTEQGELRKLLRAEPDARRWVDYGGDGHNFLGIRYALACWLDEIFCAHPSEWGDRWNNNKLETALYNTNERGWKFWEEARRAEERADKDALEGFYLCVILGFRGEMRGRPREVAEWRDRVEAQFED